ncbi:MAG: hypothetical protein BWY75_00746 [bacterium ADurb.Bin425]|jgi:hypothetical protein|uniref:Uncharacterized protein n=1 Tax=Candidatus Obscuribacter phosphatis TaxID=1906157 RepID=A0A8J7TK15_9BACT|nr:hypothetical protein [Candidatus Obscuribacter phosphatis]OPZ90400.1 MAG: hypothetical protein BWY75_00746 [bacterium ADurb.Bin425]
MEKIFSPGKWFVGFCALFVCIFLALKYVHQARLEEMAKLAAADMFTWSWDGAGVQSSCEITKAKVLKSQDNDAEVMVEGVQKITKQGQSSTADCKAVLKMYRSHNNWMLGTMEAL